MKAEGALTPENRHKEVDSFGHTLGVRGLHDLLSTCGVSEAHLYARAHQSMLFHSYELPESNSVDNPFSIDREPPCCSWASPSPSPSWWAASPSEHLRSIRASTCLRSSKPAVCIHASSLSRIPGIIRAELAEILYHVETDPVRRRLALRSIRRRTYFGRIGAQRAFW